MINNNLELLWANHCDGCCSGDALDWEFRFCFLGVFVVIVFTDAFLSSDLDKL